MTFTTRGRIVLAAGILALAAATVAGSWVLGLLALAALAAVGGAGATTVPPKVRLFRSMRTIDAREGEDVTLVAEVDVELRGVVGRAAIVAEMDASLAPPEGAVHVVAKTGAHPWVFSVTPREPGAARVRGARLTVEDALGLVRVETVVEDDVLVRVMPRPERLRGAPIDAAAARPLAGPFQVGQAGPGSDFFALRDFQHGDSQRDVNWRASARTGGRLVVNQREKESPARVTYLLDARAVSRVGDGNGRAWTMELRALAAMAAANARSRNRPRAFAYGSGDLVEAELASGDGTLATLLAPLCGVEPAGEATIASAVVALLPRLTPRSPVVVLSTLLQDFSAPAALQALTALDMRVTLVMPDPVPLLRVAGAADDVLARAMSGRDSQLEAWRGAGARTVVWEAGEPFELAVVREALAS